MTLSITETEYSMNLWLTFNSQFWFSSVQIGFNLKSSFSSKIQFLFQVSLKTQVYIQIQFQKKTRDSRFKSPTALAAGSPTVPCAADTLTGTMKQVLLKHGPWVWLAILPSCGTTHMEQNLQSRITLNIYTGKQTTDMKGHGAIQLFLQYEIPYFSLHSSCAAI